MAAGTAPGRHVLEADVVSVPFLQDGLGPLAQGEFAEGHSVLVGPQIDVGPALGPVELQLLVALAIHQDLDGRAVAVGDALAVAVVLLEAVAVVVEGALDASWRRVSDRSLMLPGSRLASTASR
jgi:hypothetical protein